jgi:endonuclease YncB( thermonuclease family)
MKGKVKKGTVKCIDRNTLRLVLLGPVGEKGYYMEKRVNVHCVNYFEDSGLRQEAFEYLRKRLVGNKVEFEDYKVGKDVNADIFLDKKNVGFELVVRGLAKSVRMGEKTSKYYDDLKAGEKKAETDKVGYFKEGPKTDVEGLTRKEKREMQKHQAPQKLEDLKGKVVSGYIDDVNFNLSFKLWVAPLKKLVDAKFFLVRVPVIKKEHVIKLKNWMSKNIYQKDFQFKIMGTEDDVVQVLETSGEVLSLLMKLGWSRLESEAASEMPAEEFGRLREAQDEAQNGGLRIWKGFKKKNKGKQIKCDKWPLKKRIEVKVVEVHNGDTITVQEASGERLRIFMTNLKSPRYNWAEADKGPAWSFEAREYTRTNLIKKKVGLEMDVRKVIVKEEEKKEIIINAGTVFLKDKPFGVQLLERGLAELNIVKGSEDLSSALKVYTYASEKAKKTKKGIYGKKSVRRTFWDYSKPENKKKLKSESNLEPSDNLMKAVVERCISASRLKLRLDSEGCFVVFVLNSVKSIRGDKNMTSLEKWFEKGQVLASDLIAQRDVSIEIENIDNVGNVHGSLFVGKKNYAAKILEDGVAYLDTSWGKCRYHSVMSAAQEKAKQAKTGFWKDESVVMTLGLGNDDDEDDEVNGDLQESKAPKKKDKIKEFKGELSECESADLLYIQRSNKMKAISKILKDNHRKCSVLEEPVSMNTLCIAFFDGEYHRCRIVSRGAKKTYRVFFIDWGNFDNVPLTSLKVCPKKAMNIIPQARSVSLAHIRVPYKDQEFGYHAIDWIQGKLSGKKVTVRQLSKHKGVGYAEIYLKDSSDIKSSLNYMMCLEGYALPDIDDPTVGGDPVWKEAYNKALETNPDLNRVLNEE